MDMEEQIRKIAFEGRWESLIPLLREHPGFINLSTPPKHYTPLHQAAWHGASLAVVGQLLKLGADIGLKTHKGQTPADVAREKHPERLDLEYVLAPRERTIAQLIRKVAATPSLFGVYDGNQLICDQLIACFGIEPCRGTIGDIKNRVSSVFGAVTGVSLSSARGTQIALDQGLGDAFAMVGDVDFWNDRFMPTLESESAKRCTFPFERELVTVSDLFHPAPQQWGLRGSPFLWIEMRRALCQVELPPSKGALATCIGSAFTALTGHSVKEREFFFVSRFARGGMSSGHVSCEFWINDFIPLLERRLEWLEEMWRG